MFEDETDDTPDDTTEKTVPLKALQAERQQRQALADELARIKAAQAEAERVAAEKTGEFKRLYEEAAPKLKGLEEKVSAYEAREAKRLEALQKRNEERIKAIPEDLRDLVPELEPEAKADWLDRFSAKTQTIDTRPRGGRAGGGDKPDADAIPEALKAEVTAEAQRYGKDPAVWYKTHKPRFDRKLKK